MVLAQRLNFTQAADDLFMAQPALSRLISALEKELDLQLFYRNSRSVALTPAGTVFFKKCPKILDEYRGSVVAARLAQEGYRGSLTLGIMRDTFEPKLPTLYQRFRTAYPHVSLLIRGYSHSSLLSALERGEVDAILNYMPMPSGQESPSILLHKNHQCIITALDHPLASRGSIRMEEVKDEPFVVMARTASIPGHDFIWKTAADAGFAPHVVAEATHVPVLLTLVSCGIGISTLSDDMACLCQGKVAFIPLLGVPFANVRLMWNEDNHKPALPNLGELCGSICLKLRMLPGRGSVGLGGAAYSGLHFLRRVTGPLSPSGHTPSEPEYTGRCSVADRRRPPRHPPSGPPPACLQSPPRGCRAR